MTRVSLQLSQCQGPWCAHAPGLQARTAINNHPQRRYIKSQKYAVKANGMISSPGQWQLAMPQCHRCNSDERRPTHHESKLQARLAASACAVALVLSSGAASATAASGTVATSEAALELQQAYNKYSERYDDLDGGAAAEALGFPLLRQQLLAQARGRVLEVAVGTGLNLPYYRWAPAPAVQPEEQHLTADGSATSPSTSASTSITASGTSSGVTSLAAVDLSPGMLAQAKRRVEASPGLADRPITFQEADVAALPFPDGSFDTVVDTFSLCVFPDPQAAVNEMTRLLSPASSAGGQLLLLEHSRSDNPLLAAYQDLTAGPVAALGKGCMWNQDVEGMVARAGLRVESVQRAAAGTVQVLVASKQ